MTMSTPPRAQTPQQQAGEVLSQDAVRLTRAWQDSLLALWDGYSEQLRRSTELALAVVSPTPQEDGAGQDAARRLAEATRAVGEAQGALAQAWLGTPFWPAGQAGPLDLQAAAVQLAEANRELTLAYFEEIRRWQRAASARAERALESMEQVVDVQVQLVRRLANDTRELQQATLDATRSSASATRETANRILLPGGLPPATASEERRRDR